MRGKEWHILVDALKAGITPAYAGKSCAGRPFDFGYQDHPRVCGEKFDRDA